MKIGEKEIKTGWVVLGAVVSILLFHMMTQDVSQDSSTQFVVTTDSYTYIGGVGWRLVEAGDVVIVELKHPDGVVSRRGLPTKIGGVAYTCVKLGHGAIVVKVTK